MFELFRYRNGIRLVTIGVVVGFCVGCAIAAYRVSVHQYFEYKLYAMIGFTFQEYINRAVVTALLICLVVVVVVLLAHVIVRITTAPDRRSDREKFFGVILLCLIAGCWAVDAVHQNWTFSWQHHVGIFLKYDIAILLGISVVGWLLMKINLGSLISGIGKRCSILSLLVLLITGILNGALYRFQIAAASERPNIIFISIDALRPDHMGCYGYHRNTTPNIDAFAHNNILFQNAFIHEPWTLPAHMSMLTGLYSITHGVYGWNVLDSRIPTLTEYLKNKGYFTIACVNSIWLNPRRGFGKGFDRYMLSIPKYLADPLRQAENQNTLIIPQLEKNKRKPFFAFIHYYDVHSNFEYLPYDASPPFNRMFTPDNGTEFHFRVPNIYASEYLRYIHDNKIELSEAERQHIIDLYDNGIAYMDHCIGELFQALKAMDLYDNTMIIITADHGEEFQEHGGMLHANPYYYDVLMHVPLIVKLPESSSERTTITIDSLVELIDIKPSILDYLGIESVAGQGKSFLDLINGKNRGKDYVYGMASTGSLFVRSKKWKLMSDAGLDRNRYRLYDVENDPNEQNNVALEYPQIEEYLEGKLRARIAESLELRARMIGARGVAQDDAPTRQFRLDEEQQERLRSLGYVL